MASAETAGSQFSHNMVRVRDPQVSVKFYTEVLGITLLLHHKSDFFTLYLLAYDHCNGSTSTKELKRLTVQPQSPSFQVSSSSPTTTARNPTPPSLKYGSGNSKPGNGFCHIAITVADLIATCDRFERLGIPFKKKLTDGKMKDIAFILDPDGYWIEIVPPKVVLGPADE